MARWVRAADCRQLREQGRLLCQVDGQRLALFFLDGRYLAIDNHCPHQQGPVGAGKLAGHLLTCPWHDRTFDLVDGRCVEPGTPGLRQYAVRVQGDDLLVELAAEGAVVRSSEPPSDATASPQDGIYRYLVRYGALGHVGRFGSIRPLAVDRGAAVVLHTDRGLELGTVLVARLEGGERGQPPAGELLRAMTDADRLQSQRQTGPESRLLEDCRRMLASAEVALTVVDAELLFDGQTVLIYHLGPPSIALGPVASRLAQKWSPLKIRFESADLPERAAESPATDLPATDLPAEGGLAVDSLGAADLPGVAAPATPRPRTFVEQCKRDSRQLRGTLAEELGGDAQRFSRKSAQLLQFHGVYQQRKRRRESRDEIGSPSGGEVADTAARTWQFMVRIKADGGRLSAAQLLCVLELAEMVGLDAARITSRQAIQLHGVARRDLRNTLGQVQQHLLSTFGACGDVNRNVMCCPAPIHDGIRQRMQATAGQLARHLAPRSSAWFDIWVDEASGERPSPPVGEPAANANEEPVYGRSYLPRKMKTAIGLPEDNCVEVHTQDVGLLAVVERAGGQARLTGYNILVGGGLGVTPADDETFPRLAEPLAYCDYGDALQCVAAIVELFRDHGKRTDRRRARLKYLLHDWGRDRFRETLSDYLPARLLLPSRDVQVSGGDDHLGWHAQGDGLWFLGLHVPNGRLRDSGSQRLRTFLLDTLRRYRPTARLTPRQDLLLCNILESHRAAIEASLEAHGIVPVGRLLPLQREAMACPALPTCGLAITEAEGRLPQIVAELVDQLGTPMFDQTPLSIRMSGCPNGCVRTATSEIGLVGQAAGRYQIMLGGSRRGDRLAFAVADLVPVEQLVPRLRRLLLCYLRRRDDQESLGDFCVRWGAVRLAAVMEQEAE
jgi:sulfite reductase (ferredoxin)